MGRRFGLWSAGLALAPGRPMPAPSLHHDRERGIVVEAVRPLPLTPPVDGPAPPRAARSTA